MQLRILERVYSRGLSPSDVQNESTAFGVAECVGYLLASCEFDLFIGSRICVLRSHEVIQWVGAFGRCRVP